MFLTNMGAVIALVGGTLALMVLAISSVLQSVAQRRKRLSAPRETEVCYPLPAAVSRSRAA